MEQDLGGLVQLGVLNILALQGASVDSPSRIVLLTEVQPEKFEAAREAAALDVTAQKGADSAANGIVPNSSSTEKAERPLSGDPPPSTYRVSFLCRRYEHLH